VDLSRRATRRAAPAGVASTGPGFGKRLDVRLVARTHRGRPRKLRQVPVGKRGASRPSAVRWVDPPGIEPGEKFVKNSVQAMDEAVLSRLRQAIAAQAGGEEEQLNGVLRMLGAEIPPPPTQVPLFSKAPAGQAPKP
jgi:hypothetical protein